ncbi:MAG: hypothetical protein CM15mP74_14910 [Halieaceae bacterium]|nr:MAG: hypothetical protein CM15mP74_14910 [Halieaceae bacterium]
MVIVSDIRMPGMDGIMLLSHIKAQQPNCPSSSRRPTLTSIAPSAPTKKARSNTSPNLLTLMRWWQPFNAPNPKRIQIAAASAETRIERTTDIIGNAPAMQEVFRAIGRLAQSHITVLINGESGTGKELVARALHRIAHVQTMPLSR